VTGRHPGPRKSTSPEMVEAGVSKLDLVTVENLWDGTELPEDVVRGIFHAMLRVSPATP
jgi:hypothetical protein